MFKKRTFAIKTLSVTIVLLIASLQLLEIIHMNNHGVYGQQEGVASFPSDVVQASANSVYFIFPDSDPSHSKPPSVYPALLSDWTAIGVLYAMCSNMPQNTAPDTRSTLFSNQNGAPVVTDSRLVLFGGPIVNAPVHYYEANQIAPLYWQNVDGVYYWYQADGTQLDATALSFSDLSAGHKDMFAVESFIDGSGNHVYIVYGYGWKGTFAGGKFFKFIMYTNISSYTGSYYVFEWTDGNGDGFVDLDEISTTPIAQG